MKESPFGFEYSWADLQPVRVLAVTVFGAQAVGAVISLLIGSYGDWFVKLWLGGALATFPAFLVGLALQARITPGRIAEHKVMVRRMGLIALLLTVFAVAIPLLGLFQKH